MNASVLRLPSELTLDTAMNVHRNVQTWLKSHPSGSALQMDATDVVRFDTAALALLLDVMRQAQQAKQSLTMIHWPAGLMQLARIYGVATLLDTSL